MLTRTMSIYQTPTLTLGLVHTTSTQMPSVIANSTATGLRVPEHSMHITLGLEVHCITLGLDSPMREDMRGRSLGCS